MTAVICNHPCDNWDCPYHPVIADGNGREYAYKDISNTDECIRVKEGEHGKD